MYAAIQGVGIECGSDEAEKEATGGYFDFLNRAGPSAGSACVGFSIPSGVHQSQSDKHQIQHSSHIAISKGGAENFVCCFGGSNICLLTSGCMQQRR